MTTNNVLLAAIGCPHAINDNSITLHFDGKQEGHNALNQLGRRLDAAIEADRQRRGEPVAWPKTAAEIRDFIDVHYISMAGDYDPSEDDKYTLTAHDLLSAFRWWTEFAPQPAEPVKVPSDDQWQTLIGWLDRRRHYPTVQITGEVAGDLADLLARYGQK